MSKLIRRFGTSLFSLTRPLASHPVVELETKIACDIFVLIVESAREMFFCVVLLSYCFEHGCVLDLKRLGLEMVSKHFFEQKVERARQLK